MIFKEGDRIIIDDKKAECIISNEEYAVFGEIDKIREVQNTLLVSIDFGELFIVSNGDKFEDLLEYEELEVEEYIEDDLGGRY